MTIGSRTSTRVDGVEPDTEAHVWSAIVQFDGATVAACRCGATTADPAEVERVSAWLQRRAPRPLRGTSMLDRRG